MADNVIEHDDDLLDNDILDLEAFNQLLSMDDEGDDDHGFSKDIVDNYFEQARVTFADMDKAFVAKDLTKLSSLGHFLKGSSATIGVKKVQECCKRIQYLGKLMNADGVGQLALDKGLKSPLDKDSKPTASRDARSSSDNKTMASSEKVADTAPREMQDLVSQRALNLIAAELKMGKEEYKKAEEFLRFFYEADMDDDDDDDDDDGEDPADDDKD
ncbi:Phosphorelay intermediate protein [Coemansia interrupta]|uniref:Phosphorelay intermediate protein n=1 Tax=Coemansia interrupta TaxID=1126814 RepID=A0A9W8HSC8_9FUNG|nr:Phosphorelay intermediate protein [Coemansia interrupta]